MRYCIWIALVLYVIVCAAFITSPHAADQWMNTGAPDLISQGLRTHVIVSPDGHTRIGPATGRSTVTYERNNFEYKRPSINRKDKKECGQRR